MAFQRFTEEQMDQLFARYAQDPLFRTWVHTLCVVERQMGDLNAVEVWSETEEIRRKLMSVDRAYQDTMVEFLFTRLYERHKSWQLAGSPQLIRRSPAEATYTSLLILTVFFTQMADGAPDKADDAAQRNPNAPLCRALEKLLREQRNWTFVSKLLAHFFAKQQDNRGNEIVLPPTDYLGAEDPAAIGEETQQEVEQLVKEVLRLTRGILPFLRQPWERYEQLWLTLCANPNLRKRLKKKSPNSSQNRWGKNWKLVANVIGILKATQQADSTYLIEGSDVELCAALRMNMRSYISKHADYGGFNCALSKELHKWVEEKVAQTF